MRAFARGNTMTMMALRQGELPAPLREPTGNFAAVTEPLPQPTGAELALTEFADKVRPWEPWRLQEPRSTIFNALAREYTVSVPERAPTRPELPSKWSQLTPALGRRLIEGLQGLGGENPAPEVVGVKPNPEVRRWEPPLNQSQLLRVLEGLRGLGGEGSDTSDTVPTEPALPPAPAPLPPPAAVPARLEQRVDALLERIEAARVKPATPGAPDTSDHETTASVEVPAGNTGADKEPVVADTDEMAMVVGVMDRINEDLAGMANDEQHIPWWLKPEALALTGHASGEHPTDSVPDQSPSEGGIPEFLQPYAPPSTYPAIEAGASRVVRAISAPLPRIHEEVVFGAGHTDDHQRTPTLLQTTGPISTEGVNVPDRSVQPNNFRVSKAAVVGAAMLAGAMAIRRLRRGR